MAGMAPAPRRPPPRPRRQGFTLLEIIVVVVLVGLLTTIAIPSFGQIQRQSRVALVANDLRAFHLGLETFYTTEGEWPPNQPTAEEFPAGAREFLPVQYSYETPIGGRYRWRLLNPTNPKKTQGYVQIEKEGKSKIQTTDLELQMIDQAIDDGNIAAGDFYWVNKNQIRFYLDPK